ncbi:MAG: hypothetical protein WD894_09310 [Pirellulales bacterium]
MLGQLKLLAGLALWGSALYGALNLSQLHASWEHAMCGPWGCGPPTQAVVAMHTFWFVLILPVAGVLSCRLSPPVLRRLGMMLTGFSVCVLVGILSWQAYAWWSPGSNGLRPHFIERVLFSVATLIDVPVVQTLFAGMVFWLSSLGRHRERVPNERPRSNERPHSSKDQE